MADRISDSAAHILRHVNAEAATSDASQVPGVAERATKIRELLAPFAVDSRRVTRKGFLLTLRETLDVDVKGALDAIDADDDGQNINLMLAEWVGKGSVRG